MSNRLEIFTFGSLRVAVDGEAVTGFISRKVEALLVYLALELGDHPREVLAEMFWPDQTQSLSLANLRSALFDLQQKLEPFVQITRYTVSLSHDHALWIDASELERGF